MGICRPCSAPGEAFKCVARQIPLRLQADAAPCRHTGNHALMLHDKVLQWKLTTCCVAGAA